MSNPTIYAKTGYLSSAKILARYGIAARTLSRWEARGDLFFPQPIRINGRKYWNESRQDEWDAQRQQEAEQAASVSSDAQAKSPDLIILGQRTRTSILQVEPSAHAIDTMHIVPIDDSG